MEEYNIIKWLNEEKKLDEIEHCYAQRNKELVEKVAEKNIEREIKSEEPVDFLGGRNGK